jgi:CBS domain-containing protein
MSVAEIVREDTVTVDMEDSILDVAETLREERVGSAVVLNVEDEIVGMVTDRDLVVYGQMYADALERTLVNEILSAHFVSVPLDTSIDALTETMREAGVRRVPVVEDGELYGIVTLDDVVVHLAEELGNRTLQNLAAVIESESPPRRSGSLDTENE